MITVSDLGINFSGQDLFKHVDLKFVPGNCYGVIGANGAGKSTFLRILSGDLEPTSGEVIIDKRTRMSVLKQDHFAYDEQTVLDTIIQGNPRLYEIMQQKDALYAKEDFTDEDGELAAQLEGEFAEMNGWEAETEAGQILSGLGLDDSMLYDVMGTLGDKQKVKILLARALFGHPDIILLDEPTNHLDIDSIRWLEDFLMDYDGTGRDHPIVLERADKIVPNRFAVFFYDAPFNALTTLHRLSLLTAGDHLTDTAENVAEIDNQHQNEDG